ncbi:MAG TPA: hypothetical protein VJ692_05745 [Nitrospiraceae bacterium]|nr:hypothetical protein [Nitrospiraceae bacterium]
MAAKIPPTDSPSHGEIREVELLKVVVSREGRQVQAQWALHPQLKKDLPAQEFEEVTELMSQVTGIVSTRFSEVLSTTEPDNPGTA